MTKFQSQVGFDFSHFYQLYPLSRHTITKQNVLNHKKVLDHTGQFRASLNFELWVLYHFKRPTEKSIDFILKRDLLFFQLFLLLCQS